MMKSGGRRSLLRGRLYDGANFPDAWAGCCAHWAVDCLSDYDEPTPWDNDAAAWVAQAATQPASWIDWKWDEAILTAERMAIANLIREIISNPFQPVAVDAARLPPKDIGVTETIYNEKAFDQMLNLEAAREAVGCTNLISWDIAENRANTSVADWSWIRFLGMA